VTAAASPNPNASGAASPNAAPASPNATAASMDWTAYAAERVQREGRVLGVDLTPFKGELPPHAEIRQADAFELDLASLGGPASFDVVLSDMAPATTGHRFTDQSRSEALFLRALEVACTVLAPGGAFVGKIFQGGGFQEARAEVRRHFGKDRVVRPEATRKESYEVFLCGVDFTPGWQEERG